MGNPLFGVDIAGIINGALKGKLNSATLHVRTPGVRGSDPSAGTNPTETDHACEGVIVQEDRRKRKGSGVSADYIYVLLIGDSISSGTVVPKQGDRVTIQGAKHDIHKVETDPANATYKLHCTLY